MSDLTLGFLAFIVGVLSGIYIIDIAQRKADRAALKAATLEMKEAQAKLAELHNESVGKVKALTEKIQGIDMMLSSGATARNPFTR